LKQHGEYLQGLLLEPDFAPLFAQLACPDIELKKTETEAGCAAGARNCAYHIAQSVAVAFKYGSTKSARSRNRHVHG